MSNDIRQKSKWSVLPDDAATAAPVSTEDFLIWNYVTGYKTEQWTEQDPADGCVAVSQEHRWWSEQDNLPSTGRQWQR